MNSSQRNLLYRALRRVLEFNLTQRRVFFCINPGRSGSKYLAELLGTAKKVTSYHEAEPTMTGEYLRLINTATYADSFHKRVLKATAIKKIISRLPSGQIYCETNHMFIKTFFDVVLEHFKKVEVIVLHRELSLVLKSFIELGYFSPANDVWQHWMCSPNAKTAAVSCITSDENMDQYDLCIAYLIDIIARTERFKQDYPWVITHEMSLDALNDYASVERLFRDLRITPTNRTKDVIGKAVNERKRKKKEFNNPTDLQYCLKRISLYIEKAGSRRISLPKTVGHDKHEN